MKAAIFDGKVIKITKVKEDHYLHNRAILISIFMSVFNVHVNRVPVSGKIEYINYRSGKYKPAYKNKASARNEQMGIGINSPSGRILIKQIAGIIARRNVSSLKEEDVVKRGERFGMIKNGSRVDLLIPITSKIFVKINEPVTAGETIIAKFQDNREGIDEQN